MALAADREESVPAALQVPDPHLRILDRYRYDMIYSDVEVTEVMVVTHRDRVVAWRSQNGHELSRPNRALSYKRIKLLLIYGNRKRSTRI